MQHGQLYWDILWVDCTLHHASSLHFSTCISSIPCAYPWRYFAKAESEVTWVSYRRALGYERAGGYEHNLTLLSTFNFMYFGHACKTSSAPKSCLPPNMQTHGHTSSTMEPIFNLSSIQYTIEPVLPHSIQVFSKSIQKLSCRVVEGWRSWRLRHGHLQLLTGLRNYTCSSMRWVFSFVLSNRNHSLTSTTDGQTRI